MNGWKMVLANRLNDYLSMEKCHIGIECRTMNNNNNTKIIMMKTRKDKLFWKFETFGLFSVWKWNGQYHAVAYEWKLMYMCCFWLRSTYNLRFKHIINIVLYFGTHYLGTDNISIWNNINPMIFSMSGCSIIWLTNETMAIDWCVMVNMFTSICST